MKYRKKPVEIEAVQYKMNESPETQPKPKAGLPLGAAHGSATTDTQRMDWLERNLMHISHDRTTCSVDMSGRCVRGQLVNEARGANGGPSYFRVNHRSLREAIDAAMQWPNA